MPLYCEEWLIDVAKDILLKHGQDIDILNLFCGMNKYGFRIDIKPEVNPDLIADVHEFTKKYAYGYDKLFKRKFDRQTRRSITPQGFARAFFEANQ